MRNEIGILVASPTGGRPTRRMLRSCSSVSSGMSEKSISLSLTGRFLLLARQALAGVCGTRADDPRRFAFIGNPYSMLPEALLGFGRIPGEH